VAEGPLFISCPVGLEPSELREGMTFEVRWTAAADWSCEYNLPVFGPARSRGNRRPRLAPPLNQPVKAQVPPSWTFCLCDSVAGLERGEGW
jgi:hypothetical protein